MAEGKNKEFIANPQLFLQTYEIARTPQYDAMAPIPSPGPASIDLVPGPNPGVGRRQVMLENFIRRRHGIRARLILAYWLPAVQNQIRTIQLQNAANYFFTSPLSGCLFAAYKNAPAGPLIVEHTNARGNAVFVAAQLTPRLAAIYAAAANGPVRILTPMAVPAAVVAPLGAVINVIHYPDLAWVIGGRLAGGWRFRYKLSGAPAVIPVL